MKIVMKQSTKGASNPEGTFTQVYGADIEYSMEAPWQQAIAQAFIDNDLAEVVVEKKAKPKKQATKKKAK
tara:strand:+ start:44 stop:253 length:210 start_codon:yes stop_codon:yes gene_type:complete